MNHNEYEETTPVELTLNENGTLGGAYTGTWTLSEGTSYITLKLGNTEYSGVLADKQMEPTAIKCIGFTACSGNGTNIWGYKMKDKYKVAYSALAAKPVTDGKIHRLTRRPLRHAGDRRCHPEVDIRQA